MADLEQGASSDEPTHFDTDHTELPKPPAPAPHIFYQLLAECLGTFLIIVVGLSSVNAAVIGDGVISGNLHVGLMFALGIAWAIYAAGPISGAHLNPALTGAIALLRRTSFPLWKVPLYWIAQFVGGFLGAALNYAIYLPAILKYESVNDVSRGSAESRLTFAMFGGVFPFPGSGIEKDAIGSGTAFLSEMVGTGLICFLVFMLLDERNNFLRGKDAAPVLIALSAAAWITCFGAITGSCLNPARDGGPRIFAAIAGWGRIAFPGEKNGFWVYWLAPSVGAVLGGAVYDYGLARAYE